MKKFKKYFAAALLAGLLMQPLTGCKQRNFNAVDGDSDSALLGEVSTKLVSDIVAVFSHEAPLATKISKSMELAKAEGITDTRVLWSVAKTSVVVRNSLMPFVNPSLSQAVVDGIAKFANRRAADLIRNKGKIAAEKYAVFMSEANKRAGQYAALLERFAKSGLPQKKIDELVGKVNLAEEAMYDAAVIEDLKFLNPATRPQAASLAERLDVQTLAYKVTTKDFGVPKSVIDDLGPNAGDELSNLLSGSRSSLKGNDTVAIALSQESIVSRQLNKADEIAEVLAASSAIGDVRKNMACAYATASSALLAIEQSSQLMRALRPLQLPAAQFKRMSQAAEASGESLAQLKKAVQMAAPK